MRSANETRHFVYQHADLLLAVAGTPQGASGGEASFSSRVRCKKVELNNHTAMTICSREARGGGWRR
jgi:hypothetical protein